jgi:geranylgeranylglycerol-phosphate geranylgeranyltransferase
VCGAMLVYNRVLKRQPLVGNLAVALLASLPFLYGAWSAGDAAAALPLMAFGVPLHLAREIAKDVDDVDGDALDRRTLPMAIGARRSRAVAVGAVALFALAAVVYCARGGRWSLLAMLVPSFLVALVASRRLLLGARGVPALLKGAMLCAMAGALGARTLR